MDSAVSRPALALSLARTRCATASQTCCSGVAGGSAPPDALRAKVVTPPSLRRHSMFEPFRRQPQSKITLR